MNALINLNQHIAAIRQILEYHLTSEENQIAPKNLTDISQLPPHEPLTQLIDKFNLSPFDIHILLLCTAAELDPIVGQLCADFHGNAELQYPTPFIACNIFPNATWSAFDPDSPLIKWKLIELKTDLFFAKRPIAIDPSILLYLLGNSFKNPQLKSIIKPVKNDDNHQILSLSHQGIVEQIIEIRNRSTELATKNFVIQLCGDDPTAKTAIATRTASVSGNVINEISLSGLASTLNSSPRELDFDTFITLSTRFTLLTDSFFIIDCDDINLAETGEIKLLNQLLKQLLNPIIILSATPLNLAARRIVTLDIPKLTPEEQATIWQVNLGETATELGEYINSLTHQFNLPAAAIESACIHSLASMQRSRKADTDFDLKTALWDNCRTYARPSLDTLATRIETQRTWEDLVLPYGKKQALKEIVWHAKQKHTVYIEWGFDKETRGLGINALFSGTSGTGKTTAAEIIAKELHLDLYRIDLSAVVSKYIGETEKNLAQIFAAAESSSVVLLFDEADSLFGKRSQVKDSRDRYANLEVSYLLQRMESYQGLSILTTNFKDAIDSAFERRLRFVVDFPFPDNAERFEMWRRVFPEKTPTAGLDFTKLANLHVTGANIRNIALNGAFLAAQGGEAVQMKHLLEAAMRECKKENRPTIGTGNWVRVEQTREL